MQSHLIRVFCIRASNILIQAPPVTGLLSQKLFAKAKTLIPGGVNSPVRAFRNVDGDPFFVRRAKGSRIEDVDGKHYIDYVGSWGPNILGHAPIVLTSAIHEASKDGISYGIPNPQEVEMAIIINDWVPSVEKVRMVSSGTEATMSAIRLARGFTGRDKIVKFEGCYHGHADSLLVAAGSGALTFGEPDSAGVPQSFANETITLPYNNVERLEEVFHQSGEQIAAVIVESYPANAGLVFPREGYLKLIREITRKHGALVIFDEVMTGFRLAKGGVQELENFDPDLTAMGKVIGGGLPVGAFGGRAGRPQDAGAGRETAVESRACTKELCTGRFWFVCAVSATIIVAAPEQISQEELASNEIACSKPRTSRRPGRTKRGTIRMVL